MKYRYDSEAREEYRNAIHFCGKAAERFSDAIEATIERIRNAPTQCREIEPGVRVCRVPDFPYSIYYIVERSEIIIVAVKHDRRDPATGVIECHDFSEDHRLAVRGWRRRRPGYLFASFLLRQQTVAGFLEPKTDSLLEEVLAQRCRVLSSQPVLTFQRTERKTELRSLVTRLRFGSMRA